MANENFVTQEQLTAAINTLSQSVAQTYETKADAASTYETKAHATATYLPKEDLSKYIKFSDVHSFTV